MAGVRRMTMGAALVLLASCGREGGTRGAAQAAPPACRVVREAVDLPAELRETSGAAFDPRRDGVFWTHRDSGGEPVLYAIGTDGAMAGRARMPGARNRDWEDMALGPCGGGGGGCVYAADVGDNRAHHPEVVLYRAPLPVPGDTATPAAQAFRARYPGGPRDAEAMFVTADGGVYLVNKGQRHDVELWRWPTPLRPGPVQLERVRTLAPPLRQPGDLVTGAAASADGRWVAVRSYGALSIYRTADLLGGGAPALAMDLAPLGEPQGEAVALRGDGTVLLTSEGRGRLPPRAVWLGCPLP